MSDRPGLSYKRASPRRAQDHALPRMPLRRVLRLDCLGEILQVACVMGFGGQTVVRSV